MRAKCNFARFIYDAFGKEEYSSSPHENSWIVFIKMKEQLFLAGHNSIIVIFL